MFLKKYPAIKNGKKHITLEIDKNLSAGGNKPTYKVKIIDIGKMYLTLQITGVKIFQKQRLNKYQ